MATVQKQGKGYKITVTHGRDYNGRKIRKYMTWVPEPGMSERQIKKELERQAVLFEETGAPIFPDSVTQWFSGFISRSGMPKVTVHSLRHTHATLMISDGVPLVVVSRQLGHARTSTTANLYGHVIAAAQAKGLTTFSKFDNILAPTKKKA